MIRLLIAFILGVSTIPITVALVVLFKELKQLPEVVREERKLNTPMKFSSLRPIFWRLLVSKNIFGKIK
jgi:hypothetical protein